jgi:predicted esterase
MTNAWYTPTSFTPIPVGRSLGDSMSREEHEEDEEFNEGEDEILKSVDYVCGLVDGEVDRGVKLERIVVGGFSQGCAVSLVTALASRYKGRLAGVVGLSGYLPRGKKIKEERKGFKDVAGREEGNTMKVFLAHGTKDMLVPVCAL